MDDLPSSRFYRVSRELLKMGYTVTWFVRVNTKRSLGATESIRVIQQGYYSSRILSYLTYFGSLISYLCRQRVQAVYINCWFTRNAGILMAVFWFLKLLVYRIFYDVGDPLVDYEIAIGRLVPGSRAERIARRFFRIANRLADHLFVTSEILKEKLVRQGIKADKITSAYFGFEEERFRLSVAVHPQVRAIRQVWGRNRFIIGWFGTMSRFKGFEEIIVPLISEVPRVIPNALFVLAGRGQCEHMMREFCNAHPEAPVEYLGWVPYDRVQFSMAACDVIIVPLMKQYEQSNYALSRKISQAVAVGVPVITVDTLANRTHFGEFGSIVLVSDTPSAFIGALTEIAAHYPVFKKRVFYDADRIRPFSLGHAAQTIAAVIASHL